MRVSTGEQSLDLQRDALAHTGCERIYDDVCLGRATDRLGLSKALNAVREGDALVVWKLDRIGRSLPHRRGMSKGLCRFSAPLLLKPQVERRSDEFEGHAAEGP